MKIKYFYSNKSEPMNKTFTAAILVVSFLLFTHQSFSQNKKDQYNFTFEKQIKTTCVKDQAHTGTCWSFATLSFLEAEILRLNKGEFDLSEMFFAHKAYQKKAELYMRYHGDKTMGQGGQSHDITNLIREYGIMPESAYSGLMMGEKSHNHNEMEEVVKSVLEKLSKNDHVSPRWKEAVVGVLNAYLGPVPETFEYAGKLYTPKTFAKDVATINPDDYVEITSFTHHPFYKKFILEIPDNWSMAEYYNVPLNELIEVFDYALDNGYSIAWDGDVSEKEFRFSRGVATDITPDITITRDMRDRATTAALEDKKYIKTRGLQNDELSPLDSLQINRQYMFDNYFTTDDHIMHITGRAKDQNGKKFYYVKNSWGEDKNSYNGYVFMSENYMQYKTVAIMVHRKAVPPAIAAKLGIKQD